MTPPCHAKAASCRRTPKQRSRVSALIASASHVEAAKVVKEIGTFRLIQCRYLEEYHAARARSDPLEGIEEDMRSRMHRRELRLRAGAVVVIMTICFGQPGFVFGQTQSSAGAATPQADGTAQQAFEVASIKPSAEDGRRVMIGISPGGRFTASGVTVRMLIQEAYDVRDFQIAGGPGWIASERYDIVAKSETPGLNRDKIKVLLQSLLAERFNLKLHRETKELPIYALIVGKSGNKLHKSEIQTDPADDDVPPKMPHSREPGVEDRSAVRAGGSAPRVKGAMIRMGRGQLEAQMAALKDFASLLAQQVGRPVVDKTGLEGKYDFKLEWTPDESMRGNGPFGESPAHEAAPAGDSSGPSIFTALQEQLGLKLESEKGPVEILAIDHIDKASAN